MIPYQQLTKDEKESNLKLPLYSGIYASGEAHFYDSGRQILIDDTFANHISGSILSPTGLQFHPALSNAFNSRNYAITDFSIFNKYVHESPSREISFDTSIFLTTTPTRFNMYSLQFRNTNIS